MQSYINRIVRAAKLDVNLYEEVEGDKGAMGQAMGVVVLSSIAAGIGTIGTIGVKGIIIGAIIALIAWYAWAYITYFVGAKILPEPQTKAHPGELLRTIGFASSPGLIRVFAVIPGIAGIIFLITSIWMLIAMVIAVKQALDYQSTLRAVGVCIIGWVIQTIIIMILFSVLGGGYSKPV
ncbi:MAG: hypothetical protein U9R02_13790 [Thermodesulfobacteriota bacterium]|nr:hypothetical protein [Thermodesulfobacteriota bacterium]